METFFCRNEAHGAMVLRTSPMTPEVAWCGTWYDCPKCSSSVLIQSPELQAQLAEQQKARDAQLPLPTPKSRARRVAR
jgi:hypothetical protein